jgi:hypothetical protein
MNAKEIIFWSSITAIFNAACIFSFQSTQEMKQLDPSTLRNVKKANKDDWHKRVKQALRKRLEQLKMVFAFSKQFQSN